MDFLNSQSLNLEAIFKFNDITPITQKHLRKVYAVLLSGIAAFSLCTTLNATSIININPIFSLGVIICTLILDIAAYCISNKRDSQQIKAASFYCYATFLGFLYGSTFLTLGHSDAVTLGKISITAGLYTTGIFTIFSLFSLITCRRMGIFFGSVIGSLFLSLISLFFISNMFLESLIALAVGILYVVIDTQMIIYKTENGEYDIYGDAKELFIDFIKILFEIIRILTSLSKEKKKDD